MPAPKNRQAENVLPPELLTQVMKYTKGEWLYIPAITKANRQHKQTLVKALAARGVSQRQIAKQVGYSERNVHAILVAEKAASYAL